MSIDRQSAAPLDGNAAAGLLADLFALDVTAAEITCAGCGAVAAIAELGVYGAPMGAILRCGHCGTAVLRLTHTPAGFALDLRGARRLFIATAAA